MNLVLWMEGTLLEAYIAPLIAGLVTALVPVVVGFFYHAVYVKAKVEDLVGTTRDLQDTVRGKAGVNGLTTSVETIKNDVSWIKSEMGRLADPKQQAALIASELGIGKLANQLDQFSASVREQDRLVSDLINELRKSQQKGA